MPHPRPRYLIAAIKKDLTWSPIVSLLGMRQVGKTTLLKQIASSYLTLDNDEVLNQFDTGKWGLIESSKKPLIVDEAQKCVGLFDRTKLIVDRTKAPGQFVLTGSVRFLSRRQIRESLTGRTSLLELLPMTMSETHSKKLGTFIADAARLKPQALFEKFSRCKHFSRADADHYMHLGGMPGACFKRDESVRSRIREAHIETLLMRDIQLLIRTRTPYRKLRDLLVLLTQIQGQPFSLSNLGRRVQLSTPTIIQMIQAFEDLFLIRRHGKSLFLSDCGMGSFLGAEYGKNTLGGIEHFVFQELYAQLNYSHRAQFKFGPYQTRGGIRIPFIIELSKGNTVAIIVDQSEGASEKSLKSLGRFKKQHRKPCVTIVLHSGREAYTASTDTLCLPYHLVCSN